MKTPEETKLSLIRSVLSEVYLTPPQWNGIIRVIDEYAKQYVISLLPSDEEIITDTDLSTCAANVLGSLPINIGTKTAFAYGYRTAERKYKEQIINKLK